MAIFVMVFGWALKILITNPQPERPSVIVNEAPKPVPVHVPSTPSECLDFSASVSPGKYEVLIKNKCTVEIPSVKVVMKFMDVDNNRIGWASQDIAKLGPVKVCVGRIIFRWMDTRSPRTKPRPLSWITTNEENTRRRSL
jgi:hypothetical protein